MKLFCRTIVEFYVKSLHRGKCKGLAFYLLDLREYFKKVVIKNGGVR